MKNTITLRVRDRRYVATYSGPHRARIVDWYNTDTLVTPWDRSVDAERVRALVADMNPESTVLVVTE